MKKANLSPSQIAACLAAPEATALLKERIRFLFHHSVNRGRGGLYIENNVIPPKKKKKKEFKEAAAGIEKIMLAEEIIEANLPALNILREELKEGFFYTGPLSDPFRKRLSNNDMRGRAAVILVYILENEEKNFQKLSNAIGICELKSLLAPMYLKISSLKDAEESRVYLIGFNGRR